MNGRAKGDAVEVRAESDKSKGPGHAVFVVSGMKSFRNGGLAVSIRRSSGRSLGPEGWQVTDAKLLPEAVEPTQDGARIFVGPSVVDHMESLENYRLGVHLADGETQFGSFVWRNIAQSPLAAKRKTLEQAEEPFEALVAEPEPISEPEPLPEPAPVTAGQRQYDFSLAAPQEEPKRKGSRLPLVLALLALLLGGLLFYFWGDVKTTFFGSGPEVAEPGGEPGEGGPEVGEGQPEEGAPQAEDGLARARQALSGELSAEDALELGRSMYGAASDADAAFLLLEFSADMGNPEAALLTARFYDPTFEGFKGTIMANPAVARQWYQAALDNGVTEAGDDLGRLKAWVEAQARAGDRDARELLQDWR